MNTTAWGKARKRAAIKYAEDHNEEVSEGFYNVRVHDLKHTFGRRLRAAGVSKEDRSFLLGHTNGDTTTHYSAAEIENLIAATNKISESMSRKTPALTLIRRKKALKSTA